MKQFLITYHFTNGTKEEWHEAISEFIRNVENDPDLKGKISYHVMKSAKSDEYFHLASPKDEEVVKILETRDYFKRYQEKTKLVSGGTVVAMPLETIAETK